MVTNPTASIRVGLLGYGLAGSVFHGPLIRAAPSLSLDAIVTADPERQARASREHPGAKVLAHAEDLWEMADGLDLVVVATPNRFHVPLAHAALDADLAVVVDKPIAPSSVEAHRLLAAAREGRLPLTVFQNRCWDGDFLTVRRLLDADELGTVARFESRFERWRPAIETGWRESGAPGEGGGVLFDLGAHLIDQAMQLFGPVTSLYAEVDRRRPGVEVDDDAFIALTHISGTRSHLWMSAAAAQLGPRFRVLGGRAGYTKFGFDVQEDALADGARPGDRGFAEETSEHWGVLGSEGNLRTIPTERGRYDAFYPAVAAALNDASPMPVEPADSVRVLELIEAANRSASTGQTIRLD